MVGLYLDRHSLIHSSTMPAALSPDQVVAEVASLVCQPWIQWSCIQPWAEVESCVCMQALGHGRCPTERGSRTSDFSMDGSGLVQVECSGKTCCSGDMSKNPRLRSCPQRAIQQRDWRLWLSWTVCHQAPHRLRHQRQAWKRRSSTASWPPKTCLRVRSGAGGSISR